MPSISVVMPAYNAEKTLKQTVEAITPGVVDEINLTVCPLLLGGREAPTITDGVGFHPLDAAAPFTVKSSKQVGGEMFLVLRKPQKTGQSRASRPFRPVT